jgi:hypothetical protein
MPSLWFTLIRVQKSNDHSEAFSWFSKNGRKKNVRVFTRTEGSNVLASERQGRQQRFQATHMWGKCAHDHTYDSCGPYRTCIYLPRSIKGSVAITFLWKGKNGLIVSINKVYQIWQYTWKVINICKWEHTINNLFHELLGENSLMSSYTNNHRWLLTFIYLYYVGHQSTTADCSPLVNKAYI